MTIGEARNLRESRNSEPGQAPGLDRKHNPLTEVWNWHGLKFWTAAFLFRAGFTGARTRSTVKSSRSVPTHPVRSMKGQLVKTNNGAVILITCPVGRGCCA
jgi:hypothetical protein